MAEVEKNEKLVSAEEEITNKRKFEELLEKDKDFVGTARMFVELYGKMFAKVSFMMLALFQQAKTEEERKILTFTCKHMITVHKIRKMGANVDKFHQILQVKMKERMNANALEEKSAQQAVETRKSLKRQKQQKAEEIKVFIHTYILKYTAFLL